MTIELLYTSAAQGLKQGSRGFCTVVCTAGLPINLAQRLEALSGYRHLYQPGDVKADENPVCHSHIRLVVGGKTLSIVSRVAAYGVDYSQRTNKIAHHVVFDGSVPSCGPAAVLAQSTVMRATWDGECKTLASGPVVPPMGLQPAPCQHWQRMAGDAGWAGVVANAWLQPTGKPVWIVFSESQSKLLLMMMQEATALLPESRRWQATFSTYCTNLPPDVECRVRCVVAGSDEARMSIARGVVLDLTKPLGMAPESEAAEAARNGFVIGNKTSSISAVESVPDTYEDPDDDFEKAFANGTSGEAGYGLQPRMPSVAPILIKSPKNRGKLKAKRIVAETSAGSFTAKRNLVLAIAGVAFLLCLFGGVGIWLASINPLAGIVEHDPVEAKELEPKPPQEKNVENEDLHSQQTDIGSPAEPPAKESKPVEKQLSLSKNSLEWDENIPILEDLELAAINTDADFSEIKISDPSVFKIKVVGTEHKLMLLKNPGGFDFEKKELYESVITVGNKSEKFHLRIANVPEEPNLTLVINSPSKGGAFAGEKIKATEEGIDPDGSTNPKFNWLGLRNGTEAWVKIEGANTREFIVPDGFSEVWCQLEYESSLLRPTLVESKRISVNKVDSAVLNLRELFFATTDKPCVLRVNCLFEKLVKETKNDVFHAEWNKKRRRPFVGNNVEFEVALMIQSDQPPSQLRYMEVPSDYFKGERLQQANTWLKDACNRSVEVRQNRMSLIDSLNTLPSSSILSSYFKKFAREVEELPNNEYFDKIRDFTEWLEDVEQHLKYVENPPAPSKDKDGNVVLGPNLNEYKRLQLKFSKFDTAFAKTPFEAAKNRIDDLQVNNQIRLFFADWSAGPNEGRTANKWVKLHNSVGALKTIVDNLNSFEVELESVSPVRVFRSTDDTPGFPSAPVEIDQRTIKVKFRVDVP